MTKHLNTLFAGLALVVAIFAAWLQFRDRNPEITLTVTGTSDLRSSVTASDLTTKYFYKGSVVENVWAIYVKVANSGRTTIVGTGANTQLIDDSLPFTIKGSEKILGVNNISGPDRQDIAIRAPNTFLLKIDQLLPTETISLEIIVEGSTEGAKPLIESGRRSLINGEIKVVDFSNSKNTVSTNAPAWIPMWMWKALRGFAIPFFFISGFVFLFTLFRAIVDFLNIYKWQKNGAISFSRFISNAILHCEDNATKDSMHRDLGLVKTPWKISSSVLEVYEGVDPKVKSVAKRPMFEGLAQGLFSILLLSLLFILNIYAAMVIHYS